MTEGFTGHGNNEPPELLKVLTEQITQNPHNIEALFGRARLYSSQKKYAEALDDVSAALALQRRWVEAWVLRAEIFAFLKDYDSAFVNYDVALKLDLRRAGTYWSRARLYEYLAFSSTQSRANAAYREKQARLALADYNMALKLEPLNRSYLRARARLCKDLGEFMQSLTDYNRVVEQEPGNLTVRGERAEVCTRMALHEEALADYSFLIDRQGSAILYEKRGMLYRAIGEYYLALQDLQYALNLNANSPQQRIFLHQTRADIFQQLGMPQRTIEELKQLAALEEELFGSGAVTLEKIKKLERKIGSGPLPSAV